jgi:hypothetical protein
MGKDRSQGIKRKPWNTQNSTQESKEERPREKQAFFMEKLNPSWPLLLSTNKNEPLPSNDPLEDVGGSRKEGS